MKAPKLLKYPKKPKMTASITAKQNYIARCKDVDKENKRRVNEFKRLKKEEARINGIISSKTYRPTSHDTTVLQRYKNYTGKRRKK